MSDTAIIDVTFVDAETGDEFMKLKVPLRQLPERDTALTIGKDDWLVVDVTPSRVEEIVKASKVSLVLRKVQYVDPNTILFSLPTVADVIPEEVVQGDLSHALLIVEDDWLQFELVPREVVSKAEGDLAAVREVLLKEREGAGFKRLHVRKGLAAPFEGNGLTLPKLKATFGIPVSLAYRDSKGPLLGCFAFHLPSGAWLYGQESGGAVVALGLTSPDDEALGSLDGLTLIDWCAGHVYEVKHG
jgi:hypothetical protein